MRTIKPSFSNVQYRAVYSKTANRYESSSDISITGQCFVYASCPCPLAVIEALHHLAVNDFP